MRCDRGESKQASLNTCFGTPGPFTVEFTQFSMSEYFLYFTLLTLEESFFFFKREDEKFYTINECSAPHIAQDMAPRPLTYRQSQY